MFKNEIKYKPILRYKVCFVTHANYVILISLMLSVHVLNYTYRTALKYAQISKVQLSMYPFTNYTTVFGKRV